MPRSTNETSRGGGKGLRSAPLGSGGAVAGAGLAVGLSVLAFPPFGLWPAALLAHGPLFAALEGRRPLPALALGWAYLVGMGLGVAHWMIHALSVEYGVGEPAAWLFTALVIAGVSAPGAAALALYAALRPRLPRAGAPLVYAGLFSAGEWIRAEGLACPWLLPAHPLAAQPLAMQTADLWGAAGVGLCVVALGAGIGGALIQRRMLPVLVPALLAACALIYGAWRLAGPAAPADLEVVVVQAAVPQRERFAPGSALRNTRLHAELTRRAVRASRPDLVVWSETAVDVDLERSPAVAALLEALVEETGVPLVTGAPRVLEAGRVNAVVLLAPGRGLAESYAKQRLVPFAEFDPPWGSVLAPLVPALTEGEGYAAGPEPTVFWAGPAPFSTPVCFEITYPDLVRRFREQGAALLVNVSNDAWFGRSGYAEIHLHHAVFRAVEFRSWVVRAANTGISAAIDPRGRLTASLPVFEEGVLRTAVGVSRDVGPYQRAGDVPFAVALTAVLALGLRLGRAGR